MDIRHQARDAERKSWDHLRSGRTPGPEDAIALGTSDALEAEGLGGADVLEGVEHGNGGDLGLGRPPPRSPAGRGGAAAPVAVGVAAGLRGIAIATS